MLSYGNDFEREEDSDVLFLHLDEWKEKERELEEIYSMRENFVGRIKLALRRRRFSFDEYREHILSGLRLGILKGQDYVESAIDYIESIPSEDTWEFEDSSVPKSGPLSFIRRSNPMLKSDQHRYAIDLYKIRVDFVSGKISA